MKRLWALMALFAATALSANIDGTWKATAEGPRGTMSRTFVFKTDGAKLMGETTSSIMGKSVITNGKVDGDRLSFTIVVKFQDEEMAVDYRGQVKGDEIELTAENADGGLKLEWRGRKAQ
ncbi:MAG: hypothetical protein KIT09_31520 [Bryobacteraceae bacterium]|nr:hypothetical protein [Bryobacteraceae bacterium]